MKEITVLKENGMAVQENGDKIWFKGGLIHRDEGPAIEYVGGDREWRMYGKRHRLDGPALDSDLVREWWVEGKRHRLNGPAVDHNDGEMAWYVNGLAHRVGGPAIVWNDGSNFWYQNGKLHREDGPAEDPVYGDKEYWLHGVSVEKIAVMNPKRLTMAHIENAFFPEERFIYIEIYGWHRFLKNGNFEKLDVMKNTSENFREILYDTEIDEHRLVLIDYERKESTFKIPREIRKCTRAKEFISRRGFFDV